MPISYVAFCPLGDKCGRHGRRLGAFPSKEEAIAKTVHHLLNSINHDKMDTDEADALAGNSEYPEEEWEEEPQKGKDGKGKGSKSIGKGKGWHPANNWEASGAWDSGSWRSGPYSTGHASSSSQQLALAVSPGLPSDFADLVQALTRAESSARTASKVARAAALAFDDEATIMASMLGKIKAQLNK